MLTVVLVQPRYAGNVGSVARAAKNFGFRHIALIDPPVLGGEARAFAASAQDVLADARVTDLSVLDEFDLLVGTSGVRAGGDRNLRRVPAYTPRELAEKLDGTDGDVALLFGREDRGLSNEVLDRCDLFVTIPTSEEYPVMNLSHAVTILLYELRNTEPGDIDMAPRHLLDRIQHQVDHLVQESPHPEHKRDRSAAMLNSIIGRAGLTAREANTLLGLLKDLEADR